MNRTTHAPLIATSLIAALAAVSGLAADLPPSDAIWETATAVVQGSPESDNVSVVGWPTHLGAILPARTLSPAARAAKLAAPTNELLLPYYTVNAADASGTTTLFAIRNILTQTVTLRADYFPMTGGSVTQTTPIAAHETITRNLRDVATIPITQGGFKQGWAILSARDSVTGALLTGPYFHGDTFVVTPADDFAVGTVLEDSASLCELWDTRFAAGGGFDDTEIRLTMPFNAPGTTNLVATLRVYDEPGNLVGEGNLTATGSVGRVFASDILASVGGGPNVGVIEWTFVGGLGFISLEMQAEGRYAAGWTPACLDSAF
jgi:hypothetical protein